jgi:hypothetical protein
MIDFRKFYNATFYDSDMNPVSITDASLEVASEALFMSEYDFSQVPDLPFNELVETLIRDLPIGFTFVRTNPIIVNTALEGICKRLRSDIKFIDPCGDIDKDWYAWALPALLLSNSYSAHELYTVWKLNNDGNPCGLVGSVVGLTDFGVITKNTMTFFATAPNWQVVDSYKTISTRLLAEYCPNLIHPNFILLLSRAYIKLLDFEKNWIAYRTLAVNKFLPGHIAMTLDPLAEHDIKSISAQVDYPRYVGLATRSNHEIIFSYKALL